MSSDMCSRVENKLIYEHCVAFASCVCVRVLDKNIIKMHELNTYKIAKSQGV